MSLLAPIDHDTYAASGYMTVPLAEPAEVAAILDDAAALERRAATLDRSTGAFNLEAPGRSGGGYAGQGGTGDTYPGVLRKVSDVTTLSEHAEALSQQSTVTCLAAGLLGADACDLVHSILWFKPPRVGSPKPPHQDAPYLDGEPGEYVTLWIALDPCTPDNGCLTVAPGSHLVGPIGHHGSEKQVSDETWQSSGPIAVPLAPGEAIAFHPCLLHASAPNASDRPRRALMLRYRARRICRG